VCPAVVLSPGRVNHPDLMNAKFATVMVATAVSFQFADPETQVPTMIISIGRVKAPASSGSFPLSKILR
jgi:hypothetical protein